MKAMFLILLVLGSFEPLLFERVYVKQLPFYITLTAKNAEGVMETKKVHYYHYVDFYQIHKYWLQSIKTGADVDDSGYVDFVDFAKWREDAI